VVEYLLGEEMITRDQIANTLTEAFPRFTPDSDDVDLPYVVLGDFARFLLGIHELGDEDQLRKAAELIERLHIEGNSYVKEAATIGLLEGIQNTWGHAGADPEAFARRLLPESRRWWDSLNKFWQKEIPYVGADLKEIIKPSTAPNGSPAARHCNSEITEGPPSVS
jgi:hypothetical protein